MFCFEVRIETFSKHRVGECEVIHQTELTRKKRVYFPKDFHLNYFDLIFLSYMETY